MAEVINNQQQGLILGDPAPWFKTRAIGGNPNFNFNTLGGRFVLLYFFKSSATPETQAALELVRRNRDVLDDAAACFFGVTCDPKDESEARLSPELPGIRYFLDDQGEVTRAYHFLSQGDGPATPAWVLIDPMLRIVGRFQAENGDAAFETLRNAIKLAAPINHPPILVVPNVLEAQWCRSLIDLYNKGAPEQSGFMREVDGKTVLVHDTSHKVRTDLNIEDEKIMSALGVLVRRRLVPMVERAFQFKATRMERYLVARYDAENGGHFAPHRDNTTKGTAHRRFAVTINLNAEDYDGGDLIFPEFGQRTYRAPTGGAIVFSCSMLHMVTSMTRGQRYAFLPFLYDEAAAKVRVANNAYLGEGLNPYQNGSPETV